MDFFGITKLNMTVNADEVVAEDAALRAQELVGSRKLKPISISATRFTFEDMVPKPGKIYGENNLKTRPERRYSSLSGRHRGGYILTGLDAPESPPEIIPPLPKKEMASAKKR
ncbi:hypothetical protein HAZT_HAZT005724 [Hyalella azteca]|uniref:Uncharacterized protein n=1 Tax=Hyalella azteca TaxID=294128 RepID=A0A6A0H5J8_HYAAZ|nr:hypothetical protein HAZT_HAZT005724 [Hyalella azteca]